MIRGLEQLSYKDRLNELKLFSQRKSRVALREVFHCPEETTRELERDFLYGHMIHHCFTHMKVNVK